MQTSVTRIQTPLSEQELQANRFALISRLADDLAHEVRNPLHAVFINLEVLRRRVAAGDATVALERAAVIEHEIHRVHEIVDQLLRLLRPDRSAGEPVDVEALVGEVASLVRLHASLDRTAMHYEPCPAALVALPRDALRFALLNLAEAVLDVARAVRGSILLAAECDADVVRIRIAAEPPHADAVAAPAAVDLGACFERLAAAHFHAERLLGEGSRIVREERGSAPADAGFLLLLPRASSA